MSLLNEYIARKMTAAQLEDELNILIKKYNKKTGRYLFIYAGAISKQVSAISLNMDDYYVVYDMLRNVVVDKLDFYIETPGGSGEAAEEIVRFLHSKFKEVSFVISGEAKSAGTIMALSGDEIKMTKSGSLGPIDAQMVIGRSPMSAYDYMEWVKEKRDKAAKDGKLNPFDATMIAQITPGELNGVSNALSFAGDMVIEWLVEHKFKNWNVTEVKKRKVTPEQKKKQAEEIVSQLVNHTRWRTHGRSIKIEDLERLGLKIFEIDSDPELSDIIYRIQTVIKLIFGNSSAYKYLAAENVKLALNAAQARSPQPIPATASSVELDVKCQRCGKVHKLYAKLEQNQNIDKEHAGKGSVKFPSDNKLRCDCGFEHDLMGMRNAIEKQTGRKIVD